MNRPVFPDANGKLTRRTARSVDERARERLWSMDVYAGQTGTELLTPATCYAIAGRNDAEGDHVNAAVWRATGRLLADRLERGTE